MLTVQAPAKINLTLEVLSKRDDGYHEIRSVIQTIDLCDSLSFEPCDYIDIKCDSHDWDAKKSLIPLAVSQLKENAGCSLGVSINITKKIPLLSGLAGDSSGAAAVLTGLNSFWKLGYTLGELVKFAEKLGSDIPFFLSGGTALVQGRGELVSPLPSLPMKYIVLLIPEVQRASGKTGRLYASLNPQFFTNGEITDKLVSKLAKVEGIDNSSLFNVFERVAYKQFEGLDGYHGEFLQAGAEYVHIAGSGPTLFTMVKYKATADEICNKLLRRKLKACSVKTLGDTDFIKVNMMG